MQNTNPSADPNALVRLLPATRLARGMAPANLLEWQLAIRKRRQVGKLWLPVIEAQADSGWIFHGACGPLSVSNSAVHELIRSGIPVTTQLVESRDAQTGIRVADRYVLLGDEKISKSNFDHEKAHFDPHAWSWPLCGNRLGANIELATGGALVAAPYRDKRPDKQHAVGSVHSFHVPHVSSLIDRVAALSPRWETLVSEAKAEDLSWTVWSLFGSKIPRRLMETKNDPKVTSEDLDNILQLLKVFVRYGCPFGYLLLVEEFLEDTQKLYSVAQEYEASRVKALIDNKRAFYEEHSQQLNARRSMWQPHDELLAAALQLGGPVEFTPGSELCTLAPVGLHYADVGAIYDNTMDVSWVTGFHLAPFLPIESSATSGPFAALVADETLRGFRQIGLRGWSIQPAKAYGPDGMELSGYSVLRCNGSFNIWGRMTEAFREPVDSDFWVAPGVGGGLWMSQRAAAFLRSQYPFGSNLRELNPAWLG